MYKSVVLDDATIVGIERKKCIMCGDRLRADSTPKIAKSKIEMCAPVVISAKFDTTIA